MFCRAVFVFAVAFTAGNLGFGQDAQKDQKTQAQTTESKPADPNVLILKSPVPRPDEQKQQFKPPLRAIDLENRAKLDQNTRMKLVQLLDAELVHTRKYLPLGDKSMVITPEGLVKPNDQDLYKTMQEKGVAAKVGDKVQITNISFRDSSVYVEINGGPKKKTKWYQHISVGVGAMSDAPVNDVPATGSSVTLQFKKQVPEMTGEELRKLLSPVLDFSVRSAAEIYMETMPPKIREAMKKHEVLVGMNKDMVIMAMDRPQQKSREKDAGGKEYEEWIYGAPPKPMTFVRFHGDEVFEVKTAQVGGQTVVRTQKEVDVKDGVVALTTLQASNSPQDVNTKQPSQAQPQTPTHRPTLRREGEGPDPALQGAPAPVPATTSTAPQSPSDHTDEPQWGTDKKEGDSSAPQKPPI